MVVDAYFYVHVSMYNFGIPDIQSNNLGFCLFQIMLSVIDWNCDLGQTATWNIAIETFQVKFGPLRAFIEPQPVNE